MTPLKNNAIVVAPVSSSSSVVLSNLVDLTKTKRFYNNNLARSTINLVDEINTPSSPVHVKSEKMRKDVMKRLLSAESPTSPCKRSCFRKLAARDKETTTIINLAVEMGACVNEAKDMALNHCKDD